MSDMKYWLWLTLKKGITSRKITALLEHFQSPEEVYRADEATLGKVLGLTGADIATLTNRSMESVLRVLENCRKHHIRIMTFDSPYYPKLLAEIYEPPYVLYAKCKEKIDLNTHMTLSMVGTRRCSPYGISMAEQIAYDLSRQGATVISGMAKGIDGAANTGALRGGGMSVAVLANGLDICYPPMHNTLMESIAEHGMVLSEYPPGTKPYPWNFLPRNRIITGLSWGTILVEAPKRSGAVNSAHWTNEQGRELFVVPGDVTRISAQGSNALLTEGALPVLCAEDVLEVYRGRFSNLLAANQPGEDTIRSYIPAYGKVLPQPNRTQNRKSTVAVQSVRASQLGETIQNTEPGRDLRLPKPVGLNPGEEKVYMLLSTKPIHVDVLAEQGISVAELASALTTLELKGVVQALPGKHYCLRQSH